MSGRSRRKSRSLGSFSRKPASREPYDYVFIYCEGETERNYFNQIRNEKELSSINIKINSTGDDPLGLVEEAIRIDQKETYDRVYCVFDRDSHSRYQQAIDRIKNLRNSKFHAVTSIPCFEFWLLLHFEYTTKDYTATPRKSICDQVAADLRKHMPSYANPSTSSYNDTKDKLDDAIDHANRLDIFHRTSGRQDKNPSANVHVLVHYLNTLKE